VRAARVVPLVPLAALTALLVALVGSRALRAPSRRAPACPEAPAALVSATSPAEPATRPPGLPRLTGPTPTPAAAPPAPADVAAARVAHAGTTGHVPHGGPRRTHRAWAQGPRTGRAHVAFAVPVGGAAATEVAVAPDGARLYVATLAGELVALSRDGLERFRVPLGKDKKGHPARSYVAPAVGPDGTVYVGSDAGKLLAVTPEGRVKMSVDLGDEVDVAPLVLPGGDVVVAAGKAVVRVDPRGNVVQKFEAKKKVYTAPALVGRDPSKLDAHDLVVVGSQDDHVYGLVVGTFEVAFRTTLGADVDGSPAVFDDGTFAVGTDAGEVVRLGTDGRVLGRTSVGGFVRGPLSIARNGDVLVGTYGPAPKVVRVRGDAIVGAFPIQGTGAREHGIHGGPLEDATGTLYFGTQDDHVYGVSTDGEIVFDFATKGDVDAPLTLLDDGTLIVPSEDGTVYAIAP